MTNFEKLQKLLEELFQLDQADLDFGIYRIMNQKRDEVVRFLEKELLPQVKEAFSQYKSADKATLQKELDEAIEQAKGLGVDPESTEKVKKLREQIADSSVDVTALENEVFSHLFNFFRRYYHEGDFISLRRYKEGVYAIPYEGEEVKLHWANHDQYYIKSSEYFRDYIFTMPSGKRVRVHLVAASSEQDNKKEAPGKERRFIICEDDPIYEEDGELYIRFEYRPDDGKKKQDALNQEAIERVLQAEGFEEWTRELSKSAPTKANPNRTLFEKHLTQYTARNTFDYFIHKDLGGFLRRELDFYIKNEVMHLDDIEHDTVPRVEQYLSKIKVIRKVAHKIIQFLEQLENFQKKLWLKKKFVVQTNYCITLDRVPEELYPEIAANDAQREEWVRLFAIDKIEKDLNQPGYTEPLTVEFLQHHQRLVIDTSHYSSQFVSHIVASLDDMSRDVSGILVHSDNFQALSLARAALAGDVRCVYVDPPYNTGHDEFLYRDAYQHSSWLAMVVNRLFIADSMLDDSGAIFVSIDDNEEAALAVTLRTQMHRTHHITNIIWQKVDSPNDNKVPLTPDHEYVICFSVDRLGKNFVPMSDESILEAYRKDPDTGKLYRDRLLKKNGRSSRRVDRPTMYFPIIDPDGNEIFPLHDDGVEACWAVGKTAVAELQSKDELVWKRRVVAGTERWEPYKREYPPENPTRPYPTIWDDVKTMRQAKAQLRHLFGHAGVFDTVKPVQLIERILHMSNATERTVLDFFAGSGTTGHAVINMNRDDGGDRRFFLVEMGNYFDEVLVPRIKKVMSSHEWSEGRPASLSQSTTGDPHVVKVVWLESYEDALNNLEMKQSDQQTTLLDKDDDLREQYILSYMLNVESRGSQSLLNIESFRNPDRYKLQVERNGETQLVNVDLVETFNWLLGLTVKHIDVIRGVRVVEGTNPDGERTLVLWRNLDETDNDALDEWFKKQDYNTKDQEYDLIYVNGDNNLENLRRGDQTWKVRMIEEEFGRLMFDAEDV